MMMMLVPFFTEIIRQTILRTLIISTTMTKILHTVPRTMIIAPMTPMITTTMMMTITITITITMMMMMMMMMTPTRPLLVKKTMASILT